MSITESISNPRKTVNDFDVFPSTRECDEVALGSKRKTVWPNEVSRDTGPKWNGEVWGKRRQGSKGSVPYLLNSEDLEDEIPNRVGAYVHLRTVSVGVATFVVESPHLSACPVPRVSAKPHLDKGGNISPLPKSISNATRVKRLAPSIRTIKNQGRLKSKKSN